MERSHNEEALYSANNGRRCFVRVLEDDDDDDDDEDTLLSTQSNSIAASSFNEATIRSGKTVSTTSMR